MLSPSALNNTSLKYFPFLPDGLRAVLSCQSSVQEGYSVSHSKVKWTGLGFSFFNYEAEAGKITLPLIERNNVTQKNDTRIGCLLPKSIYYLKLPAISFYISEVLKQKYLLAAVYLKRWQNILIYKFKENKKQHFMKLKQLQCTNYMTCS